MLLFIEIEVVKICRVFSRVFSVLFLDRIHFSQDRIKKHFFQLHIIAALHFDL